jgi:hypothetical protein
MDRRNREADNSRGIFYLELVIADNVVVYLS